jgi:predicted nucleotidyltransferase
MKKPGFAYPQKELVDFCQRWKVAEVALFGAVLRDDFRPDSGVDVLVTFAAEGRWSHFDLINMQNELEQIFEHKVELVERSALEQSPNSIRRKHILNHTDVIYAA